MESKVEQFKKNVIILSKDEKESIRQQYINTFVNMEKDYFKKKISTTKLFSDGECYTGYLWDVLISIQKMTFNDLKKNLPLGNEKVLVFWDIHSKDRILIKDYWIFEKDDIIELNVDDLLENLELLPEDIYIFNRSFKWSVVLTHESEGEEDWPKSRIILKASPIAS